MLTPEEKERTKKDVLAEMARHVGAEKAIGMGELFGIIYGEEWQNRINDTRKLRTLITALRWDGVPICSIPDREGGGYYLAAAVSELEDYLSRLRLRALRPLAMEAKIRRCSLAEMLGQMSLNMEVVTAYKNPTKS